MKKTTVLSMILVIALMCTAIFATSNRSADSVKIEAEGFNVPFLIASGENSSESYFKKLVKNHKADEKHDIPYVPLGGEISISIEGETLSVLDSFLDNDGSKRFSDVEDKERAPYVNNEGQYIINLEHHRSVFLISDSRVWDDCIFRGFEVKYFSHGETETLFFVIRTDADRDIRNYGS